ncbi:MAG: biosynthetic-type acetolactate synthase large subunit [Ruminococcaceae bacterium]|nr:biosynthetic-type acetolactate synthase large subunit [Oscillospiraceae bacterium]
MNGADLLVKLLIKHGTDTVFGYPGGTVLSVFDALYKNRKNIKCIRTADEQGAAHSADGYARVSGRVGVCIATSGPGATNLVTGIATAYMDSVPTIFITANVTLKEIGTDSFQEADITGITMPISKYNWMVKSVSDLPVIIAKAFKLAMSGRKGPIVVDIPRDVLENECSRKLLSVDIDSIDDSECRNALCASDYENMFEKTAGIIAEAKRPVIIAGGGVRISDASYELRCFAEKISAPVACTLMAIGEMPYSHKLYAGNLGQIGGKVAMSVLEDADTVISVGMRFTDRTCAFFSKGKKIIHIDIDRAEINKKVRTDAFLCGDAKEILQRLIDIVSSKDEWITDLEAKKHTVQALCCLDEEKLTPMAVMRAVNDVFGDDTYIATDVGLHQMWVAAYYPFERSHHLLTSGGFGTMGFGLGAAVGAKIAAKNESVVLITGDGSFLMNCAELTTLRDYKIPVIVVVMNNNALGMVKEMQSKEYKCHYCGTLFRGKTDFKKLANAFGIKGYKVCTPETLLAALRNAKESGKSTVIDCIIE